jgi:glycerol-3-phosphate acyltransferase PlsY
MPTARLKTAENSTPCYAIVGGVIIIVMHKDNILRLVAGTERKILQNAEKINNTTSGIT